MHTAALTPAAAEREHPAVRWTIIGLLSVGMVIAYASRSNLSVDLVDPDFITSFNLSNSYRGVLNSAFFWAPSLNLAGWVVDQCG
jgi:hypothetical protein